MFNKNLDGTEEMSMEELEDHRNFLQSEADDIDHAIAMHIAEKGDRTDEVWIAKADRSRKYKVRAINQINARLGKLRRAEVEKKQRYLEAVFMQVTKRELGDEWFFRILKLSQAEVDNV